MTDSSDEGVSIAHKTVVRRCTQSLFLPVKFNMAFLDCPALRFVFRPMGSLVFLGAVPDYRTSSASEKVPFFGTNLTVPVESGYLYWHKHS